MSEQEGLIWSYLIRLFKHYFDGYITEKEVLVILDKYEIMKREQPTLGCGELKNKNSGV